MSEKLRAENNTNSANTGSSSRRTPQGAAAREGTIAHSTAVGTKVVNSCQAAMRLSRFRNPARLKSRRLRGGAGNGRAVTPWRLEDVEIR
jgi:hypothetical protein